ncbi:TIGR03756 family integrating conjugative element protein [Vibrio sp. 10N.261.52.A1]|uniref:TIGR03756 family integrating conjugative element protein n=3 Tax=Vibrio TaxID=662 RepID=UPI000C835893|nr:TIGR03756 family integrating conjugative element protein [Vibrio sp. 10N.261.52.A1]PML40312.1 integrating conjugative element protein [Vibrio sp. 10N.261.52.A1]
MSLTLLIHKSLKRGLGLSILGSCLCATSAISQEVTTAEVIASAACPECLDYEVIGACVWMTCTPAGCSTDTSIKVKHRLPDFVVMSYPETGEAPWQDTAWMSPDNAYSENGGHSARRSVQGLDNTSMRFYNSDVIGHPGGQTIFSLLASFGYSLSSQAMPLMPHYLSSLDPLGWRYNLPDMLSTQTWNPLTDTLSNFGDVYPRGGFVLQRHSFKAAALTAFRALHVVTRMGEGRVYQPFVPTPHPGFWPPGPVKPNNEETAWQMLSPIAQTDASVWPQFDDSFTPYDPYAPHIASDDQYVWAAWRLYKGCQRRGSTLIAHFGE